MNALVKKEIRLLLPSWIAAMLLAMVQAITRPYDYYIAWLLFFGLTIMALTTMGRESSLNTFSLLLVQPVERLRLWTTKLTVLAAAFLSVLLVWLAAFGIALVHTSVAASDPESTRHLFVAVCLIAVATFTGGLWTTLLVRQLAGAFWLTLLAPATFCGFSGLFLANSQSDVVSDYLVTAVLTVVIGGYSLAGFFLARRLFFRAQDVGWSGGVITLPEWGWFAARADKAESLRRRRPIRALIGKELKLHQVSLLGAAGLLVLHLGVVTLRAVHHFKPESLGDVLTQIYWMVWLVMAPVIGSMAVAEERRLGVMEGQLCLPVSRRLQFGIKACVTLFLAIFLGGVVPVLVEILGVLNLGGPSFFTTPDNNGLAWGIVAFVAWLALTTFFASSLARGFLPAAGFGVATFFVCVLLVPVFTSGRILFVHALRERTVLLPLVVAVPTIVFTLLWLAYLNFNQFREGWPLWRRNLLGLAGAVLVVVVGSNAIYHRAWEAFAPAEPAHGPARLSLAHPPELRNETYCNLLVRLPEGRVWFDFMSNGYPGDMRRYWWSLVVWAFDPLPHSAGPRAFLAGTNWLDASARHVDETVEGTSGIRNRVHLTGYADTVGIQKDGTLWASDPFNAARWEPDQLRQVGDETNWLQFVRGYDVKSVVLLKRDGTLWRWGPEHYDVAGWPKTWPGIRSFPIRQIGTNSDWVELQGLDGGLARRADGSLWRPGSGTNATVRLGTNNCLAQVVTGRYARGGSHGWNTFVRDDGTLWLAGELRRGSREPKEASALVQSGHETNWLAVANNWNWMVAIKTDGSLWQWLPRWEQSWPGFQPADFGAQSPVRLGIHQDWLALVMVEGGMVSLAADGSLWFWPDPDANDYTELVMRLPKRPQFVGNVYAGAN